MVRCRYLLRLVLRTENRYRLVRTMLVEASKRWKILDVFLVGGAFGTLALGFWLYARFGFSPLAGTTNGSMEPHMDFDVFLHSARALWEGGDVYSENGGPSISTNPPFSFASASSFHSSRRPTTASLRITSADRSVGGGLLEIR